MTLISSMALSSDGREECVSLLWVVVVVECHDDENDDVGRQRRQKRNERDVKDL
jgi:hypothetical protein